MICLWHVLSSPPSILELLSIEFIMKALDAVVYSGIFLEILMEHI